jgi:hypothetical protein
MALEEGSNGGRRKHINVKHHYIRSQANESVRLVWVPTLLQQADILTKALPAALFRDLRARIMGYEEGADELGDYDSDCMRAEISSPP